LAGEIAQVFEQEEVFVFAQPVWLMESSSLVTPVLGAHTLPSAIEILN